MENRQDGADEGCAVQRQFLFVVFPVRRTSVVVEGEDDYDDDDNSGNANDDEEGSFHAEEVVLDPLLCSLLPQSLVENNIMPFITHVFTSNEQLIEAVRKYIYDPSAFFYSIRYWDVSQVTDFSYVFCVGGNWTFDEDLTEWNVSKGTNFRFMFYRCSSFHGDGISSWNVSNATNLSHMFSGCTSFHGDLSSWNIANATNLSHMFSGCTSFNRDLVATWHVSDHDRLTMFGEGEDD